MKSPFPGMDPYLAQPEFWSAVHNRLIVAIADSLVDHLNQNYRVEIEKRTYFSWDNDSILVGIPDVAIVTGRQPDSIGSVATLERTVQPESVTIPMSEEVTERYLEIREIATGQVVTTIEILSPKNKRSGEGRDAYETKRNRILASRTHLVEIDLLRAGKSFPIASQNLKDYRILICRGDQRPYGDLYAFDLWDKIPAVPIPIRPLDVSPILDLQSLLDHVYHKGRYGLAIDYQQSLQPVLKESDRQKLDTLLE